MHRRTAHAELGGNLLLRSLVAGRKGIVANGFLQRAIGIADEGCPLRPHVRAASHIQHGNSSRTAQPSSMQANVFSIDNPSIGGMVKRQIAWKMAFIGWASSRTRASGAAKSA